MRPALLLFLFGVCAAARADGPLYVQVPATLAPDAPVAQLVLAECNVESMVGNNVYSGVKRRHPAAQILNRGDHGAELRLTILAMRGVGPGPYTQKSIDLRADLVRNGQLVDSNVFQRAGGGSGFGRIRGTCDFFGRLATIIGRDVANWLVTAAAMPTPANAPAVSSSAGAVSPGAARDPVAVRLEQLDKLRIEGLITPAEYQEKRAEILKGL